MKQILIALLCGGLGLAAGAALPLVPASWLEEAGAKASRSWPRGRARLSGWKNRLAYFLFWAGLPALAGFRLLAEKGPALWLGLLLLQTDALVDVRRRILPDQAGAALFFLGLLWGPGEDPGGRLLTGVLCLALGAALAAPGALGMGDVKLFGALGVLLGPPDAFLCLGLSLLLSGIFAAGSLIFRPGKQEIPLGPFLYSAVIWYYCI